MSAASLAPPVSRRALAPSRAASTRGRGTGAGARRPTRSSSHMRASDIYPPSSRRVSRLLPPACRVGWAPPLNLLRPRAAS
eukprot:13237-Pelagococcus_subviridis.AAC.2